LLLTVITPVFNGEFYIEETIKSVLLAAKDFLIDYVVIDDGSSDNTSKILEKYSSGLRTFRQENKGEAAAVNYGIENALGKYCIIVNYDDPVFTSELFSISVSLLETDGNLVATYPDWYAIDKSGEKIEKRETEEYTNMELVGFSNCLPGPGACFRKSSALKAGGRNSKYKYVSDYDFWLRISRYGDLKRIPRPLAQWRSHENSTSAKMQSAAMAMERIQVVKDYLSVGVSTRKIKRIALSHGYYFASRLALSSRDVHGRTLLLKSIWVRKRWPEKASILVAVAIFFAPASMHLYHVVEKFLPNRYKIRSF
jgi:glycosyltransferase involved in cell wall biosynthesis